jgi:oxygen-independent coproporphyrinogen-3 oxidase
MDNGTLQRNFQGYSTLAGADLYAFGMSGISNVGEYYWQNNKDIGAYYKQLDERNVPLFKILKLSRDDRLRKSVIMDIMCRMGVDYNRIARNWDIDFTDYFSSELMGLQELEKDGLVVRSPDKLNITEKGRLFLRNIAMCFDRYLNEKKQVQNFSKTV